MTLQQMERQTVYGTTVGAKMVIAVESGQTARLLGKFAHLVFAYQYGLASVEVDGLGKGLDLLAGPGAVGGVCVIQSQIVETQELLEMEPEIDRPVFLLLPQAKLDQQQGLCTGLDNIYLCNWEGALQPSNRSLVEAIDVALGHRGAEDLFQLAEQEPEDWTLIESRLQHIDTLPTLPELVLQIMRLLNDPSTTPEELAELLSCDPAVVVKLMQVVRSPLYTVTVARDELDLDEVIVRLGVRQVGAVVQQIKLVNSLVRPRNSRFDLRRFWEHSVGCAIVADRLYTEGLLPLEQELQFDQYWLPALLHDVGKLVLGFFFWDWYEQVGQELADEVDFRCGELSLGDPASHERIGQFILTKAGVSGDLVRVVGQHHGREGDLDDLVCLVHMADNICKDLGLGCRPDEKGVYSERVLEYLEMGQEDVEHLLEGLEEDLVDCIKIQVAQCF